MQENFIHIMSKASCYISVNGCAIGLIDNTNTMELDFVTKTDKVFVSFEPVTYKKSQLPYTFELDTASKVCCQNENVLVVPFPNNHYDVIVKPFDINPNLQTKAILNQNIGNYYVTITSSSISNLTIFSGASIVYSTTLPLISSAKCELKKGIIVVEGYINDNNYYLFMIDTSNLQVLFSDTVCSISSDADEIMTLKNLHDISHHSVVCKLKFSTKQSEKYHVYENNVCGTCQSILLLPKDFLECTTVGDESKIRTMLCDNLKNTPVAKFQSYFGEFKHVFLNRHNVLQDKINYTVIGSNCKNYNFVLSDGKIKEIEEVFW